MHLLINARGRPARAPAEQVLADLRTTCLVAGRGYDACAWRAHLAACGTLAAIPAQPAHTPAHYGHDMSRYCQRNAIERTFAQLKQFRRFATR